jgi:chemotaxis protein CheD
MNTLHDAATARSERPTALQLHTLHPGDVVVVDSGHRLETLLGSCVAVVMTDPRRTVGAMCHIVHSKPPAAGTRATGAYADTALRLMYAGLRSRAIAPELCEAWVFGGGNMFPTLSTLPQVGDDNADWAIDALARDGVRVLGYQLGGAVYRRLAWTVGADAPEVESIEV